MRARVLAVLLILSTLPALPQCSFSPILSDGFRSSILDLAIEGNDLWAATSYGIALYDRSIDPPQFVASIPVAGTTRLVRVSNGLAYVGSGSALSVIRRNGRALQFIRSIDLGAPANDLLLTTLSLYVATRNGIAQYSLLDPTNPAKTTATFQTSQTAATSLALIGSTLYVADGDTSVETFDIITLQRGISIDAGSNAIAVHANNGKLYVSSAVQTTVFIGVTNAGGIGLSMTSLAPISGDAVFLASNDRTLRAVDFTLPGSPIDIFRDDLPPTGGTVNRINAVATAGGRLYAGAGDIGLVTYDISAFATPFPMRGSPLSNASSIISLGNNFYVGRTNGVTEFTQSTQSLVQGRSWDGSHSDVVQDGDNGFLLISSGSSMTLFSPQTQIPAVVSTTNFHAAVSDAVLIGTVGYAVLSDRTLWSADFAQAAPVPQQISTPGIQPSSIARSGSSIAIADVRADGTTVVAYYASANFSDAPKMVTIAGLATTGVTLFNATAAVQTFRGISMIDFAADVTTVLPQSNSDVAQQLFLSGTTLLELTDTALRVWNTQSQSVTGEVELPAQPLAVHIAAQSTIAGIATASGVVTVALDRLSRMPRIETAPNGNAYYKKVVASSTHVYLVDSRGVDIFTSALHYVGSIRTPGIVDVAANDSGVFTVSSNLTVNSYSPDGFLRSTASINEGLDAQALSIAAVSGAIWVSIVRGCSTSGCEKKTTVFDPRAGLNQTISMTAGITDVVSSANRAYAITDIPAEVRVIDVSDPFHPTIIASRAAEGLSISYSSGTIYVLGNTLAAYAESGLTNSGDILGPYSSDGTVTFADQHLRIDGNCAVVTGRSFAPQFFTLPQWTPATSFATPSPARRLASQPGTMYVLTDHSLEIWSTAPLPKPPRRAPAR